jgi:hypothetical protein
LFGVKANVGSNPTVTANEKGPASLVNKGKQGLFSPLNQVFTPTCQGDGSTVSGDLVHVQAKIGGTVSRRPGRKNTAQVSRTS